MNILFIGDIYGRPGRETVAKLLPSYRQKYNIDFVIANAENMRHGKGVNKKLLDEMQEAGIDFFTSGNHIFKDRTILDYIDDPHLPLLRPANYPPTVPGTGYKVVEVPNHKPILIINLMGRVFMKDAVDCPFRIADKILKAHESRGIATIFVDFHTETTSEKAALAHYLDGRVTALIGTHTHVPTADARRLPEGTAFQTDVGMTGPYDSIIGAEKQRVIDHFITQMALQIEVADGPTVFNATLLTIDGDTGKAETITPLQEVLDNV